MKEGRKERKVRGFNVHGAHEISHESKKQKEETLTLKKNKKTTSK